MEIVACLIFENRSGVYAILVGNGNEVVIIYRKLSDRRTWFVIRTKKGNLTQNFLDAASEVDGITPLDILMTGFRMGIPIPEPTIRKMVGSSQLIKKLAEQMGLP